MSHYHVCVWIDHYEAKVFGIGLDTSDILSIEDRGPHHHIHRKADHLHLGSEPMDTDFLFDVAEALRSAKAILICGPGKARHRLAGFLIDRYPALAKRIRGIETIDHPTEAQIIAGARSYFLATDRMHPA